MLRNPEHLRALIEEYGRMQRLDGFTPQSRGQRLNGLLAEMLLCWNISAEADVRSNGEIDVAFELEGRHFIAEAKWETSTTDTGAIAKLQKRLRQRLGGTVGVFVSMAGYSQESLGDLKDGEQLSVLCLTTNHVEAMLSGFIPPAELITQLVRKASRRGEAYIDVAELFDPPFRSDMTPVFEHPPEIGSLVVESVPGFDAHTIMSDLPRGQCGVAELRAGSVLLTTAEGVFLANLPRREIELWLGFPNCHRNPLVRSDGSVFLVRKSGVARVEGTNLSFVAGGLVGNASLSMGDDGEVWVFCNGRPQPNGVLPRTIRVPERLGMQTELQVDYPSAEAHSTACVDSERFLVCGTSIVVLSATSKKQLLSPRHNYLANPGGLAKLSSRSFLIACNSVELWKLDVSAEQFARVAKLKLNGSVYELATSGAGGGYLFGFYTSRAGQSRGILIRWKYQPPR